MSHFPDFPKEETTLLFPGPIGDLEVWVMPIAEAQGTAILCHPHPLYGGTMHNKVVTTLAKAFQHLKYTTIRFNFRGVGKSIGQYDQGVGEGEDVVALAHWATHFFPQHSLWLAGFSFGAYVAARAATILPAKQLVSIAPQVSRFLEAQLPRVHCPWLVIQGDQDDVVSPQAVYDWIETVHPRPKLVRFPEAGHFFHGQLTELRKRLEEELG